ncbi:MAG: EAL domain-containing protein [Actinomycetota bacterium]|nr:EAL domain-containing protein [Actinomycetota bacterium]
MKLQPIRSSAKRRWASPLIRLNVAMLLVMLAMGVIVGFFGRQLITNRVLEDATNSAIVTAKLGVEPLFPEATLTSGLRPHDEPRTDQINELIRAEVISGFRVFNARLEVIYEAGGRETATQAQESGRDPASVEASARTALSGSVTAEVIGTGDGASRELAVFVPLAFDGDGRAKGVLELVTDFASLDKEIAHDVYVLYAGLGIALLCVYVALFGIIKRSSREIRRQAAVNEHQSLHDALTGLPNRKFLMMRLGEMLDRGEHLALMFFDLDDFKLINDTLGHAGGDDLIAEFGRRLRTRARTSDVLARLGGDEFAMLLEGVANNDELTAAVDHISKACDERFNVFGARLRVTMSIGVAVADPHEDSPSDVLRKADLAMYAAKEIGKNAYRLFDEDMSTQVNRHLALKGDLAGAIEAGQFFLEYQPILELEQQTPVGVEALVRWMHPELGRVAPLEFLEIAEQSGEIVALGRWILLEACSTATGWPESTFISVNVTGRQLADEGFVSDVKSALQVSGLSPRRLILEVTEGHLISDLSQMASLETLRKMGIRIAIDDFGTGYSSLSYLHRLPLDIIKIPREFVRGIGEGKARESLLKTIVTMGQTLEVDVIAEGLEELEHLLYLLRIGCKKGQGFLFCRPSSAHAIGEILSTPAMVGVSR